MRLIHVKSICAGSRLALYEIDHGSGSRGSSMDVALIANVATVNLRVGHRVPDAINVAGVVAYMHTQGYQLLDHTIYVGEEVEGHGGNWIYMNAVFQKA